MNRKQQYNLNKVMGMGIYIYTPLFLNTLWRKTMQYINIIFY